MKIRVFAAPIAAAISLCGLGAYGQRATSYGEAPSLPDQIPARPKSGPVQLFRSADIKPGMSGIAWTVFSGTEPEAVPVEFIGLWKNAWGPRQDVILAKLGGKAAKTNVAGGMSGSPVYIDGKLVGAIALRISVFSPDAICGITPIEQMLEINEIDDSTPSDTKTPQSPAARAELRVPESLLDRSARMVPIETPLMFSGFHEATLRDFRPWFDQMGITPVQGGAAGALASTALSRDWKNSLQPGQPIAGVLVSGDLNITGLGTVTYNDGKRVLGFGHSFFNLGPLSMPMSGGEVLMVLSSQFQPNKFANATEVVGALRQDRHSGIMGELGQTASTIPVSLKLKTRPVPGGPEVEKHFEFNVFVHPRWTPFLMMLTAFNTLQDLNAAAADDATYKLTGNVDIDGMSKLSVSTQVVSGDAPMPPPMQMAMWWADKFNRLFQNPRELPKVKRVEAVLEMIPERRTSTIDSAWLDKSEILPGEELTGKVLLRPWRGEPQVRNFRVRAPANLQVGSYRLLISDSDTLNRPQMMASMANRNLDLAQTVSILNQERSGDRLYVSLIEPRPTLYEVDQALSAIPSSVLNVMQSGRAARGMTATPETA